MEIEKKNENMYNRGKIYKLVSYQTDKIYIGSTCKPYLSDRLAGHRNDYKKHQNGKYHYVTSFEIMKYEDVDIILVENYPCESKQELHARERHWIENTPNCCNKNIPTRTTNEYNNTPFAKQLRKEYDATHIEERKQRYEKNKDQLLERQKQYYEQNKEKIKKLREANKDVINERRRLQRAEKKVVKIDG